MVVKKFNVSCSNYASSVEEKRHFVDSPQTNRQ